MNFKQSNSLMGLLSRAVEALEEIATGLAGIEDAIHEQGWEDRGE